jgi:hypothetical protein
MRSILMYLITGLMASSFTSDVVNEIEPQLHQNREAFLTGRRTRADKAAALAYFDQQWAFLTGPRACGAANLNNVGANCIADRSRDGRWPWAVYYRDPIDQAPTTD